ncbi:MAG: hypothetical protein HY720_29795, partial [Planctomycetes bacterium]|nr:hypothetical protein [Planctomycetota bacterium]
HEVPCISYLWIDTQAKQRSSSYYPPDHISQRTIFQEGETLFAEVPRQAVKEYFEHPETYPHLFSWLARSSYENGPDAVSEGAGQFRPFGRLAFFHNYKRIRAALADRMNRVAAQSAIQETNDGALPFRVRPEDRKLKVFVVGSIAGGTGSGMVLDLPFLVRDVASRAAGELGMILGYLVLPDVYVHGREVGELSETERRRMQANGYACLSELEYYSRLGSGASRQVRRFEDLGPRRAVFRARWALDEEEKEFYELPFSTAYLVGNSNSRGIDLNSVRDVVEMTSEMMYLDFAEGGFTALRQQREKNVEMTYNSTYPLQYTDDDGRVFYSNPFSCRFSAFGLAKIYVDRMRLRHAGAYRLGMMLVEDFTDGRHSLGTDGAKRLASEIDSKARELAFDELIRTLEGRIHDQIESGLSLPGSAPYRDLVASLKATAAGERDWKKIGSTLSTFLGGQAKAFADSLRGELPRLVREYGAKTVASEIERLSGACDGWRKKAEKVEVAAEGPALKYAGRLAEAEALPAFPPQLRRRAVQIEKDRLAEEARKLARAVVRELVGKHAAKHLYGPLSADLARMRDDLGRVQAALADLTSRADESARVFGLARHLDELLDVRPSPVNHLLSRDADLALECKKALAGTDPAAFRARMADLKSRFEKTIESLDPSVRSAYDYGTRDVHHVHFPDLRTGIVRFCHEAIPDFLADRHAILELFRVGSGEEVRRAIAERIGACRPFVRFDEAFVTNWLEDRIAPLRYAGFASQGAGDKEREVRKTVEEAGENFQIFEHDKDSILFAYLVNGLPLCAIEQTKRFADEYRRLLSSGAFRASDFHLDKNASRFPQVTREDRESALAEIEGTKSVLAGILLGFVAYNSSGQTFVYEYEDRGGAFDTRRRTDCGANLWAVHKRFRQDGPMAESLDARRNRWTSERHQSAAGLEDLVRYRLLLSYYERWLFRPFVEEAAGEEKRTIETTEHLVVGSLLAEVDRVIAHHPAYDRAAVDRLAGDLKHWLESFVEFVGPEGSRLPVLRPGASPEAALATLRHHTSEVAARSALSGVALPRSAGGASLVTMNPIDPDPEPPSEWARQWSGHGVLAAEAGASPGSSFNPFAKGGTAVAEAPAAVPPAAEGHTEAPDPFRGL